MTDEHDTRVAEILDDASTESETLLAPEATADEAGRDLLEVAREADEFVASSEPTTLLEAVGLGTLPDGSEAESVFEGIAKGEPERVEDLHRLLRLAKLGDRSDEDALEDATAGIREAIQRAQSETDETIPEDTDRDAPSDRELMADEGSSEAAADLGDRLTKAMSSPLETFGDEIGDVQDQLEEVMANNTDNEDDGNEAEETDTREADEGDDGLLGLGDDGSGGLGSSESSRLSTMAPPPSERSDMHAVKRHSTMPKRNR
ncbi:hypothetical protein QA600_12995 [Natronococcus sp. A-GB1]|uniref:hypothetical protein n=1 Tax=Natronococcus sp. A-GB1 TaxID=3037648 RepID=UPI00241CF0CF|nr:hypothetical protein [Natronococcus sp. A-GB1]MDG5760254.1 hypothetical protein [Natronococcus sp. A-GB1]